PVLVSRSWTSTPVDSRETSASGTLHGDRAASIGLLTPPRAVAVHQAIRAAAAPTSPQAQGAAGRTLTGRSAPSGPDAAPSAALALSRSVGAMLMGRSPRGSRGRSGTQGPGGARRRAAPR